VPKLTAETLFGIEVRRSREDAGISQEELGFRAGIHRTYVSQLERGLKSPTLGIIVKVAVALDQKPSKLMEPLDHL
jgi:transcriptional regulator with XRE-family HTH domain